MTDEVKEVKQFAREVKLYQADNGYLVKVGCNWFVCEGSAEKVCDDLQAYLSLKPEIVAAYNYKKYGAFRSAHPGLEEAAVSDESGHTQNEDYSLNSTVFSALTMGLPDNIKLAPIETKYAVTNGYIVVSHKNKTATIFQQEV